MGQYLDPDSHIEFGFGAWIKITLVNEILDSNGNLDTSLTPEELFRPPAANMHPH
jgi:hypothetical protein